MPKLMMIVIFCAIVCMDKIIIISPIMELIVK